MDIRAVRMDSWFRSVNTSWLEEDDDDDEDEEEEEVFSEAPAAAAAALEAAALESTSTKNKTKITENMSEYISTHQGFSRIVVTYRNVLLV